MRRPTAAPLALAASLALAACTATPAATPSPTATPTATATTASVYRFGVVGNRGKIAQLERGTPTVVAGITGKVIQIATSNSDGYALTSAGPVWAWGVGSYGELGNGGTSAYVTRAVQVSFPPGVRIVALANLMPFDGALAIDSLGRAWGWGLNADGDLCLSGLAELRPIRIPLSDVTAATGARTHSLFDSGGRVYACGGTADRDVPVQVKVPAGVTFTTVNSGGYSATRSTAPAGSGPGAATRTGNSAPAAAPASRPPPSTWAST